MEKEQTIIYFVRHGDTSRVYSLDQQEDDLRVLSDIGKVQAEKTGLYLKNYEPAAIYSSPRKRCVQTAEIIKKTAEIPENIETDKRVDEDYNLFTDDEMRKRFMELCGEIVDKYKGKQVVIVSHMFYFWLFSSHNDFFEPCSVIRLVFANDKLAHNSFLYPAKD